MAVGTAIPEPELLLQRLAVAGLTCDGDVSTMQWECGLCAVFKVPKCPVNRVVAGATVVAETFFMVVIVPVAVGAGSRRVFEYVRGMACIAFRLFVCSKQRKQGQTMIEEHVFNPA